MKRGRLPQGFTIIEVLIFLAVSGALAISALFFVSGMQNKTQFNQAANDVLQQISSVINNVDNGYYGGSDNVACSVVTGVPVASVGATKERGTNQACIFMGRVLEFKDQDSFIIHDVVGRRQTTAGSEVTTVVDAMPRLITGTAQTIHYKNGLRFKVGASLKDSTNVGGYGAIGFFGTLAQASLNPDQGLETSAQQSDFIILENSTTALNNLSNTTYNIRRNKQMTLCLDSGSSGGQRAIITIGGQNGASSATTTMTIDTGVCA